MSVALQRSMRSSPRKFDARCVCFGRQWCWTSSSLLPASSSDGSPWTVELEMTLHVGYAADFLFERPDLAGPLLSQLSEVLLGHRDRLVNADTDRNWIDMKQVDLGSDRLVALERQSVSVV
jgi:hypothetical protein